MTAPFCQMLSVAVEHDAGVRDLMVLCNAKLHFPLFIQRIAHLICAHCIVQHLQSVRTHHVPCHASTDPVL